MNAGDLSDLALYMAGKGIELVEVAADGERYQLALDANARHSEVNRLSNRIFAPFIRSMAIGRLRTTHPLRTRPEIRVGAAVRKDQIVAYIEAGELLLPVIAANDGVVLRQLEPEGTLVGYGTRLFALDPAT